MTAEHPTRRGFLGMFAAALVMPVVAPIIAPKRSFFSFFLPNRLIHPDHFDLQAQIDAWPSGGVVRIPSGVHIVEKSIILPDNVSLSFAGDAIISGCHFTGKSKGTKNPKGIFIEEVDGKDVDSKEVKGLVTGCMFDMNETGRPLVEVDFRIAPET